MRNSSPFDHRPDTDLGPDLRAVLSGRDTAGFVRRVLARAEGVFGERRRSDWSDALTAWARPGLVAALVVTVGTVLGIATLAGGNERGGTLGDPLGSVNGRLDPPALLAGQEPPDIDIVLAVAMEY